MLASPLRYPGGKAKLFQRVSELIAHNRLFGAEYVEPYAGGAGLAIRLLTSGFVSRIRLNDIDRAIYAFWKSVLHDTKRFCDLAATTPASVEEWKRQREIYRAQHLGDPLALGFSAFYLNRTSRSGIIEGSGPIGGYEQKSEWKIDVRLNRAALVNGIELLSQFADKIELHNLDALEFLKSMDSADPQLIYLDPPYYEKGQRLYKNFYGPNDHCAVAEMVTGKLTSPWIVSYDDAPEIVELYKPHIPIRISLAYSAARKRQGQELMFLSESLELPPSW